MDDTDEVIPNHVFISLRYEFKAIRVIDQTLSPTTIKIKADVSTLDDDSDDYGFRMEVAINKLRYWVDQVLNDSVILFCGNEWALGSFMSEDTPGSPATSNTVLLCPDEPTDACLAELLLCKLSAISQGVFDFHAIDIESSDGRGIGFTFVGGNPGVSFPEPTEWFMDKPNYFTKPWWARGDASTLDVIPCEDDDLNEPPVWAYSLGFIADNMADETRPNNVVRPEFKPKVIDGGKVDQ